MEMGFNGCYARGLSELKNKLDCSFKLALNMVREDSLGFLYYTDTLAFLK